MENLHLKKRMLSVASQIVSSGARAQRKMMLLLMLFTIAFYNNGYTQDCVDPGSVQGASAHNISYNYAEVSWSPPTVGTAPFSYEVKYKHSGETSWSTATNNNTIVYLGGLSDGKSYTAEILAYNCGSTYVNRKVTVTWNTPANCTAAGTPSSASASASGATSANLSWGGSSGTTPITYYWSVKQTSTGATASNSSTTSTSASASSLSPNTQYYLEVYANNCGGNSGTRTSSNFYTYPGTPSIDAATTTSVNVAITSNTNTSTEFAIQETGSSRLANRGSLGNRCWQHCKNGYRIICKYPIYLHSQGEKWQQY